MLEAIVDKAKATIDDGFDLGLVVAGSGGAGALAAVVKSWLPEQTEGMADETVAAVAGGLLWYFGDRLHDRLVPFGFGVLLEGVGGMSQEWVSGIIEMLKKKEVTP